MKPFGYGSSEEVFCGPEKEIFVNCNHAMCGFKAEGKIRKYNGDWDPEESLAQELVQHHIETGGGSHNHTSIAHREFTGFDDNGNQLIIHAGSYGVEIYTT